MNCVPYYNYSLLFTHYNFIVYSMWNLPWWGFTLNDRNLPGGRFFIALLVVRDWGMGAGTPNP